MLIALQSWLRAKKKHFDRIDLLKNEGSIFRRIYAFCISQMRPGLPDGIHICIPKIPIRVYLGMENVGMLNGSFGMFYVCPFGRYILCPFGTFCVHLVYFLVFGYIVRLVYFTPFWYIVPRKIWQPRTGPVSEAAMTVLIY
jgi:hypothetical protein